MTTLQAQMRDASKKVKDVRDGGEIPAVFYGFKKETTPVTVKKNDFIKVFKEAGETSTVTLNTPNGDFDVLIHDVQHDPRTNDPIHIDFLAVDMTKEIEVDVPFEFVGESSAVKAGGVLVKVMHEVKVSALPSKIPHSISVDISKLDNNDAVVALKDLNVPAGVKIIEDAETVVASIVVAKDEPLESAPVDLSTIEVEAKGKKDEEGAEAEGGN